MERAILTFPAILVTGPRQSGKTTLLKMEYGNSHKFISLENPDVRARAKNDPVGFLRYNSPPLILDEIQYAPELLSYIKTLIDEDRKPGQWLFTGSQNFVLMEGISQSLAGRIAVLSLLPFSTAEATEEPGINRNIDEIINGLFGEGGKDVSAGRKKISPGNWLLRGGYPEIRVNPEVDRNIWCASYIQTYLERDVRQVLNVGDLNSFERFLRLCAARTGQILNLSDLGRDTGISMPTAKRWLSVLEASQQVFLLPPYFKNFGKRLIKSPKLYFMDTALATFLVGLHGEEPVINGPMAGPLMETAVVTELVKAFRHRGELPSLYFWRSGDGLKVDILIERNGTLYPIEVKATSTVVPGMASAIKKWMEMSKSSGTGVILADVAERLPVTAGITASHWMIR